MNKCLGHFALVIRHKHKVLKLCIKAGIPWRGIVHDLSKFSPTEFWESVKYYTGGRSPIYYCKKDKGYSEAWLHHKGRNKHHFEYWYDEELPYYMPIIPYKYLVEMICDNLAAGMTYKGKDWTKGHQLKYWQNKRSNTRINPVVDKILTEAFAQVAEKGINLVINKKNLKEIYDRNVREWEEMSPTER